MALLFTRPAQVRYELSERLGAGGFAEAWRAQRQSPMLDDEVCLKIPRRPLDAGLRRNLLEEARLLAFVLAAMDGATSVADIAGKAQAAFPELLPDADVALDRVGAFVERHAR